MGRGATGATTAGLPLTGAAIAAASGRPGLMWVLIALSGLVLLGTFANRIRGLHALPLIGAPKPTVTFRVNGSKDLIVRLPHPKPDDLPPSRTAQIEVGVTNPAVGRLDGAAVNFLLPMGLVRRKTDANGTTREEGGQWMAPTPEPIGSHPGPYDYWSEDHVDIPSRSAQLLYFNATFTQPGEYAIRVRFSAPALYEGDYDVDGLIRVGFAEDGPVERATDLIAEGEDLRRDLHTARSEESRHRVAVMNFMYGARQVAERDLAEAVPMLTAPAPFEGRQVGVDHLLSILEADLVAMYEIRRQLGRRESSETA
ncbi:MAG: hypothetical protein ACREX8_05570 [Gammaproteobacteria bacterium]